MYSENKENMRGIAVKKQDGSKNENVRMGEKLCRLLDIPFEALAKGYAVEIEGQTKACIRGGGRIILYTPEEIKVELPRGNFVSIKGRALSCSSYNRGLLGIEGYICSVEYRR